MANWEFSSIFQEVTFNTYQVRGITHKRVNLVNMIYMMRIISMLVGMRKYSRHFSTFVLYTYQYENSMKISLNQGVIKLCRLV